MRYVRLLAWALLILAPLAHAGDVKVNAFLDRDRVALGDSVTLNVKIDGSTDVAAPDLGALQKDFQIQGTSRSSSLSFANGQRSASTLWAVSLRPRHTGTLSIPALHVDGQSTRPLTLQVTKPSMQAKGTPGGPVFVETDPSTLTPYVGQQVDLTVRLFYLPDLTDGSLDTPKADGLDVRQVGRDLHYQTQRNGRTYHVVERHFALIPQRAGTIRMPGIGFQGQALSSPGFGSFMNVGRPVSARSAAFTIRVQAEPDAMKGSPWVPARNLTLAMGGIPANGQVQVGEPLTLTLQEKATGLPFESLPELTLPALDGAQVYPDKTQNKTGHDGAWLTGERERKFAVVPTRAGTLKLPAITLRWWDVVHQRVETARVPAHALTVVPAAGGMQGTTAPPTAVEPSTQPGAGKTPVSSASAAPQAERATGAVPEHTWRWLALISIGLWLLSALLAGFYWWRRRRGPAAHASETPIRQRGKRHLFVAAVRRGERREAAEALLKWARSERPGLLNLGKLAAALDSQRQRDAIAQLQRARFAAETDAGWNADELAAAFRGGLQWRTEGKVTDDPLPPLYPRSEATRTAAGGAEAQAR